MTSFRKGDETTTMKQRRSHLSPSFRNNSSVHSNHSGISFVTASSNSASGCTQESSLSDIDYYDIEEACHRPTSTSSTNNDDPTDDDDDDMTGRLLHVESSIGERRLNNKTSKKSNKRSLFFPVVVVVVGAAFLLLTISAVRWFVALSSNNSSSSAESNVSSSVPGEDGTAATNNLGETTVPVAIQCPSKNVSGVDLQWDYADMAKRHRQSGADFLETFRDEEYDAWGLSYTTVKNKMTDFKSKFFPKYLSKPGSTIYESASGVGLNLYMTIEIVQEYSHNNNTDIVVYGNDYVQESVDKAGEVVLPNLPGNARVGGFCQGDSTNLTHVPSNSFDVSYTGYVTPLLDPLDMKAKGQHLDLYRYKKICDVINSKRTGRDNIIPDEEMWMAQKLNDIMQRKEEDWYGRWVAEMSRIAKPGAPVIVEQVSTNFCFSTDSMNDWGGVGKDFWVKHAKANTYGWNIDPDSIEIMDDKVFETDRYHVFMLKKE